MWLSRVLQQMVFYLMPITKYDRTYKVVQSLSSETPTIVDKLAMQTKKKCDILLHFDNLLYLILGTLFTLKFCYEIGRALLDTLIFGAM